MNTFKVILPVIANNPAGVVGCYLFIDTSLGEAIGHTLFPPAKVNFLSVGKQREAIDTEGGSTEFDNVDVVIAEDYTNHSEGFWHKLINGYPTLDFELMFTVTEGADKTFSFRGKIYRVNVTEPEYYLDDTVGTPSSVVRGVKFSLVSSLKVFENITIAALCTEIYTHFCSPTDMPEMGTEVFVGCKYKAVLASMIKLAFGVTYDEDLAIDNSTDIQLLGDDEYVSWLDAFVMSGWFYPIHTVGDWDYSYTYYSNFSNAYELLKHLCAQWGVIPRYSYGQTNGTILNDATDKHRLTLNTRGRSSGGTVTMTGKLLDPNSQPSATEPTFSSDTARKINSLNVVHSYDSSGLWFFDTTGLYQGTPESWRQIDKTIALDPDTFSGSVPLAFAAINLFYLKISDGKFYTIKHCRYWKYTTGAYVVCNDDYSGVTHYNNFGKALINYLFYRFPTGRVQYEREYGSIKVNNGSTNSQRNCKTLMRTIINDGVTSRTFYATEVEKDIFTNRVRVVWVQE